MVFSARLGLVFIHIPKTAGSSITSALQRLDPHCQRALPGTIKSKHVTAQEVRTSLGTKCYDCLLSFAVVRNPFERMCSLYVYLRQNEKFAAEMQSLRFEDFLGLYDRHDTWIERLHSSRPQIDFVTDSQGNCLVSRMAHFERLQDDMAEVSKEVSTALQSVRKKSGYWNASTYREFYSARGRAIVASRFSADLERFGYEF
jgi:hypothetical protein